MILGVGLYGVRGLDWSVILLIGVGAVSFLGNLLVLAGYWNPFKEGNESE